MTQVDAVIDERDYKDFINDSLQSHVNTYR